MNFKKFLAISLSVSLLIIGNTNPANAAAKPNPLPGVMAVDLYMNLEKQGWKCTRPRQAKDIVDPTKLDKNKTTFDCFSKDKNAYAIAWGTTSSNLTWITADATTKTNYGWLGFIATLPIQGVDQAAAQKWVIAMANTKKSASKLFGDVKFSVTAGSGVARTLSIAHKNTKQP
jgi:hypothetical protein